MRLVLSAALTLCLIACDGAGLRKREAGALGGAAIGAGLGAIIGNQTGSTGGGIAIGSALGALSGAVIGNELDAQDDRLDQAEDRLAVQQREIDENQRLIDELRSRGADVRRTRRGVVVNLPDVLFEFDSARLTSQAERTASDIAQVLADYRDRHVAVEGHTDSIGTVAYNQRLSEDRARAVASALVRNGMPRRQITTRGFGESDPIASNRTDAGRSRNRRVEVVIEN